MLVALVASLFYISVEFAYGHAGRALRCRCVTPERAMIDARSLPPARTYGIGLLLGGYAAAVAVTPVVGQVALVAPVLAAPLVLWLLAGPARWLLAFLVCALVLPPLPFALGDTGPHICLVIVALGAFAGLLRIGEWRIRLEPVHLPILGYCSVLAASVGLRRFTPG